MTLIKYHHKLPDLLAVMDNKNELTWTAIYDKNSAMMYGNILNLAPNKALAEKIFIELFISLRQQSSALVVKPSITLFLYQYTLQFTKKYLQHSKPTL